MKSYLAQFAARAIISELVSISELAQPLESGTHFPLFLLCLQQLAKLQDREWLTELFQQSKVNMQKMLPGKSYHMALLTPHIGEYAEWFSSSFLHQSKIIYTVILMILSVIMIRSGVS